MGFKPFRRHFHKKMLPHPSAPTPTPYWHKNVYLNFRFKVSTIIFAIPQLLAQCLAYKR